MSFWVPQEDSSVGRHSLGDDQQLTYWAQRYVLRSDPTYARPDGNGGAPAAPGAFDGGGLDVPAFLWPCREAILTTGACLRRKRAAASRPRVPLCRRRAGFTPPLPQTDASSARKGMQIAHEQ